MDYIQQIREKDTATRDRRNVGRDSKEVNADFFKFPNIFYPGFKRSCKKEFNGKLAIFDFELSREGTKLIPTVYRQSSGSDRYIRCTFAHKLPMKAVQQSKHPATKTNFVNISLISRYLLLLSS